MKKFYENINVLRGMAIFLVVVGHALSLYGEEHRTFAQFSFDFIYSFHMPLFFFISGFCALALSQKADIKTDGKTVWKRFRRLMIPYIVYGILYVGLDIIGGNYTLQEFNIGKYFLELLKGDNANWQLWTLYTLFCCAVVYLILRSFFKGDTILFLSAVLFIVRTVIDSIPNLPGILFFTIFSKFTSNFFFYCLGLEIRKYIEGGKELKTDWKYILFAAFALIVLNIFNFFFDQVYLLYVIDSLLGIYVFYGLSARLVKSEVALDGLAGRMRNAVRKIFTVMGNYCMPIYLFANIFQALIRNFLLYKFHWNLHICFVLSCLLPIVLSVLIAKFIVRKSKVLRAVLLGE